eukprot:Nk52_evm61s2657 gene=Nk52_evmTU61s2657
MSQTTTRTGVTRARPHDVLYDPQHTVSDYRDHMRSQYAGMRCAQSIERVPHYRSMFSELRHHPNAFLKAVDRAKIPDSIPREWQGATEQYRQNMESYTKQYYVPDLKVPQKQYERAEVTGKNRYKYFKRPIIPYMTSIPAEVLLSESFEEAASLKPRSVKPKTPLTKTVGTQSLYRESEAQTDPYSPEYVIKPGEHPELLTLATLSWEHGLPAGLTEIEMIERARAKRAWEETLPPLDDPSQFEKRRRMMEEMELFEWKEREEEIRKLQEARLEVLMQVLEKREQDHDAVNRERIQQFWEGKQLEKQKAVEELKRKRIKLLRKLQEKRKNVEGKVQHRDIIDDYAKPSSQVYAPITRLGVFPDKDSERFKISSYLTETYEGLLELEASLDPSELEATIRVPPLHNKPKCPHERRALRIQEQLLQIEESLNAKKIAASTSPPPLRYCQKIEKPPERPPTPHCDAPSIEQENMEASVIFLQRLIRGRAIQNIMFQGKERRLELIRELRSTHAILEAEAEIKEQTKTAALNVRAEEYESEHAQKSSAAVMESLQGDSVGRTLDFLSKELVRLQEERRIAAMVKLAERQRRMREAEESGERQIEEKRRQEEEEVFRRVMQLHKTTLDSFLEDIIMGAVEDSSEFNAREAVREQADKLSSIVDDASKSTPPKVTVQEMVHGFLLPEVERRSIRERIQRDQRKYVTAAHNAIFDEMKTIDKAVENPGVKETIQEEEESDSANEKAEES